MAPLVRAVRVQAVAKPPTVSAVKPMPARGLALGLAAAAPLITPRPAAAEEADAVDSAIAAITESVKAAGSVVKSGLDIAGAGVQALKEGYEVASPYIRQGVDAVAPVVQEAVKVTNEVAVPAISKAVPVVQESLTGAVRAAGVDIDSVSRATGAAAKTAAEGASAAQPLLLQAWQFLTTSDPGTLLQYGAAGAGAYLLAPPLLGALTGGLRGYAGDVNAVAALEALSGDAVIVDIRSENEKLASGVPDVPGGASKVVDVELAAIGDRRLRGAVRDPGYIEAQVTALQIASLKRLGRGSRVLLLDRNGSTAKTVAKELARRGFGRVFVIEGGFDGRGGWVASKLLVKPAANFAPSPGPLAGIARTISTRGGGGAAAAGGARRALPAPSK